ncbi:hypothetical protein GCM10012285_67350 [Streptomyces kronopolitis]|uniref:Uncharacterized protein n=1 Tax=Streptomyces kronopolitis TaxID=1612435 RepID=A0ABQ2K6X0_9ACTN|nr:hypothetical protein GCM10012285_67350 [Streptomyces kronopolitis]
MRQSGGSQNVIIAAVAGPTIRTRQAPPSPTRTRAVPPSPATRPYPARKSLRAPVLKTGARTESGGGGI